MIGMGGSFNELSESEVQALEQLDKLKDKVREYLSYGSCDGRADRVQLRKDLAALVGCEYDVRAAAIKKTK